MSNLPRVGYFYSYFPPEILYAFQRVPVRILPTAHNGADAEPWLHKNFCALAKVTLASFLDNSIDSRTVQEDNSRQAVTRAALEGVIFTDVCDAQRRLHDVWRAYMSTPVLAFLDLPRRTDQLGQEFYHAALSRLVTQLESRFRQTLTVDAIAQAIHTFNHQRVLWNDLRAAWVEGRVPTWEYYHLRDQRLMQDPAITNSALQNALAAASAKPPMASQGPRLILMGSLNVHRGLIDVIGPDGQTRIVAEDSACDEREVSVQIRTEGTREELVRALASAYLDAPAPRLRDLPRRLDYLGHLAESRRVNGVLCSYFKFCDLFLAEFPIVKRFFEARKIPVLLIEDEGDNVLSGQARTRVQAFIEMIGG